jgi:phosphate transport system permease protein
MSNAAVADKPASTLQGATLPKWSPYAIAGGSIVLAVLIGLVGSLDSKIQWGLIAAILFVVGTYVIAARVEGSRQAKDRIATSLVWVAFLLAVVPLVSLLWTTISRGVKVLDVYFLTHSMGVVGDTEPGGGIYHAIIGSLEQVGLATLIGAPIGVLTAIYLVEYGRALSKAVTFFVDVMTGIPSIVAGLFILSLMLMWKMGALRLRRFLRPGHPDDAGRGPLHRGDAETRPERAARGLPRPRHPEVAHDPEGGPPDRDRRHHHRHHAVGGAYRR